MKNYTFYVSGTHCPSCKIFIEDSLNDEAGISNVQVDLKKETVTLTTNRNEDALTLSSILTKKIISNGYTLSTERLVIQKKSWKHFVQALPIGFSLLIIFFVAQKTGLVNFGLSGTVTPATSVIIGLIASVSSCLAVVGGLVLSLSATVSKDTVSDTKPMALFHISRLISFAILGGILGSVGKMLGINFTITGSLGVIASLVMIILGLNLVGVFKKNLITFSPKLFTLFQKVEHRSITPIVLGVGTFFLPCGFTQAMQIAAVSSGTFLSGFLTMAGFALGTLPMLAILSFGAVPFSQSKYAPVFFASSGIVVIGLGLFSLLSGLAGLGIINPLFTL